MDLVCSLKCISSNLLFFQEKEAGVKVAAVRARAKQLKVMSEEWKSRMASMTATANTVHADLCYRIQVIKSLAENPLNNKTYTEIEMEKSEVSEFGKLVSAQCSTEDKESQKIIEGLSRAVPKEREESPMPSMLE